MAQTPALAAPCAFAVTVVAGGAAGKATAGAAEGTAVGRVHEAAAGVFGAVAGAEGEGGIFVFFAFGELGGLGGGLEG